MRVTYTKRSGGLGPGEYVGRIRSMREIQKGEGRRLLSVVLASDEGGAKALNCWLMHDERKFVEYGFALLDRLGEGLGIEEVDGDVGSFDTAHLFEFIDANVEFELRKGAQGTVYLHSIKLSEVQDEEDLPF